MKKRASTDHRSEHPEESNDRDPGISGGRTEERNNRDEAEERVSDKGRNARKRSGNIPREFGKFPAIH